MQSKLQEITEKIYNEGVEKAKEEAQQIIDDAKKQAESILAESKSEAEKIKAEAQKAALESQKSAENELQLASKQAVNGLKQKITDLIIDRILKESVGDAFNDSTFVKKIIEITLKNWSASGGESMEIDVILPTKEKEELEKFLAQSVKSLLDKGLEVKGSERVESGFQLAAKDNSYKISFNDETFENYFKQYLRPKLIELIFS
ncbi:MAG: hypothetical protein MI922_21920 [Bacteroidales bacterium]|nr:hypothetical protein [Bacteroidales bacterium]